MSEIKKHTQEEANNFSPYLKHMLCRVYGYIEKFKDDPKYNAIDFTYQGVYLTYKIFYGHTEGKVIETFLNNLDVIKVLYDNQPEYLVTHSFIVTNENGEEERKEETQTVFGYDRERLLIRHEYSDSSSYRVSVKLIEK